MPDGFRPNSVNPGSQSRLRPLAPLLVLLAACARDYPEPVDGPPLDPTPAAASAPSVAALRAAAEAPGADLNAVLVAMDDAQAAHADDAAYWKLYGATSVAFAEAEEARGRTDALGIMYDDAAYAYRRAHELAPQDAEALQGLIHARRMQGDFVGAWEAAETALAAGLTGDGAGLDEAVGRAGLARVIEAVQAGQPVPAAAVPSEAALARAFQGGSGAAAVALADLLAWQNRGAEAREVLIEALIADPATPDAVGRLQNLTPGDAQVVAWERIRKAHPEAAVVKWRLGEALWNLHWLHRQNRNWFGAHDALDRAEQNFLAAMAAEASYTESCEQWLHLVRTAHGWVSWNAGLVDDAADSFLAALEADPERLEAEADPESLRLGIYSVEGHYFQQNRLDKVRSFHARLYRTYDDNPDWTNNYAFACRDLGVQRLEEGKEERARELFEESWEVYSRTVELAPDDVRLVNDRALIAVYYLDAHHELAERELLRAAQMGETQLAELAQDVPETERQDLDEATGDAYENLAYLDVMRRGRLDRAEAWLAEAVKHFPFASRPGVALIRAEMERLQNENPDSDQ